MRAAVSIDSGQCAVRNDWLERAWSLFPGQTVRLADTRRDQDWVTQESPDLALRFDGEPLSTAELGDIQWSEERCALGAALVCRRTWPGAVVITRDLAYDDHPAIQRFVSVLSLMTRPVELRAPALDALCIDATGLTVRWDGFQQRGPAHAAVSEERGIALDRGHAGLVLGAYLGAAYDLFASDPARGVLGSPHQYFLEPGCVLRLPSTYVLAYTGDLADASRTVYADLLAQLRKEHKARQAGQGEPYD